MKESFPTLNLSIEDSNGRFIVSDFEFQSPQELLVWSSSSEFASTFDWVLWDDRDGAPIGLAELLELIDEKFDEIAIQTDTEWEYHGFSSEAFTEDIEWEEVFDNNPAFHTLDYTPLIEEAKEDYSSARWNRRSYCPCGWELQMSHKTKVKVDAVVADCPHDGQIILSYLDPPLRPDLEGIQLAYEQRKTLKDNYSKIKTDAWH